MKQQYTFSKFFSFLPLALIIIFCSTQDYLLAASAANPTCASATTLSIGAPTCIEETSNGGGFSGEPTPSCATGNGASPNNSVWYSVTATDTLLTISIANNTTAAQYLSNSGTVALYDVSSCTPTIADEVGCDVIENSLNPGVISIENAVPGNTYLVQLTHYKAGGWGHLAHCAAATVTNNDCAVAEQICLDGPIAAPAQGVGNVADLDPSNQGCLGGGESSGLWYNFQVDQNSPVNGILEMVIAWSGSADYDYAFWGPLTDFDCPPSGPPARCSWCGSAADAELACGDGDIWEGSVGCNSTVECITTNPGDIFYLFIDDWEREGAGFSLTWGGNTIISCQPISPLPVELVSFDGHYDGSFDILNWETSSEYNNSHFELYTSEFGDNWELIDLIQGAGTTQIPQYYTSSFRPNNNSSINYYKLIQIDIDGTRHFAESLGINRKYNNSFISEIFPNPATSSFSFNYGGKDFKTPIDVNIYNSLGKLILSKRVMEFNNSKIIEVDLINISTGFYNVEFSQANSIVQKSISIIK